MADVKADPKAIAARRGQTVQARDPKVVLAARKKQEQANQWRREHGLK